MAAQRQSATRAPHLTTSLALQSPPPSDMPRRTPAIVIDGAPILQPGDEDGKRELQRETERQTLFQDEANNRMNIPNGYKKVAVLIIRWDEEIDEFEGHDAEIERLQNIFTSGFGYQCNIARLSNTRKSQIDLNFAILQHVREHDDPNNLLIVYYTGHGALVETDEGERLELTATQNWTERRGVYIPTAFWHEGEEPLRNHTAADALSILDCCFASTAAFKNRSDEFRTYQLLAASGANSPTCGPGKNSFTTALCDSLEELLQEAGGGSFAVTKLWEKINFRKKTQPSFIWDRLQKHKRIIQLGRLNATQERDKSFQRENLERASLDLRFSLKAEDLTREQIVRLAQQLPEACKEARVPVRRIDWVKMEVVSPASAGFAETARAVNMVQQAMRRKSQSNRSSKEQKRPKSPGKKRTRSTNSPLTTSKRQLRDSPSAPEGAPGSGLCTPISPSSMAMTEFPASSSE